METAIAGISKQEQEKTLVPLKLEALGKGAGDINSGYPLNEVIKFIEKLKISASVWTSQPEKTLKISFPTPTLFRIKSLKNFDSIIYITGPVTKQEPEPKAQGERQEWSPSCFVASIELNNDNEKANPKIKGITLDTELSKKKLDSIIKAALGKTPSNWHFNSSAISTKSTA